MLKCRRMRNHNGQSTAAIETPTTSTQAGGETLGFMKETSGQLLS